MTTAQLELRLQALEQTVAGLQKEFQNRCEAIDRLVPGAEHDLTLDVPPYCQFRLHGKVIGLDKSPSALGLTDGEWKAVPLEDEHG